MVNITLNCLKPINRTKTTKKVIDANRLTISISSLIDLINSDLITEYPDGVKNKKFPQFYELSFDFSTHNITHTTGKSACWM